MNIRRLDRPVTVSQLLLNTNKIFLWSGGTLFLGKAPRSLFWTSVQSMAPKRNNGRLEVARLPDSAGLPPAGLPPGGRAAILTPL